MITTPFNAESTAAEVLAGVSLAGRRAIVTGGASGIGIETARALAGAGAEVTLAVRDTTAGEYVAADIGGAVRVAPLDLADLASVAAFAAAWDWPLDMLVNNAGVMALPKRTLTARGYELQFATNQLGHFALALGLHDALRAADHARVVSLSSRANLRAPVDFDDLHFARRAYDPMVAYGQSKTANALFAVEAARRWAADGITVNAVHPGAIMDSGLSRHLDPTYLEQLRTSGVYTYKTREQGAATSVLVAAWPGLAGVSGHYFEDCNEAQTIDATSWDGHGSGVATWALDPVAAARLWDVSLALL